MCWCGCCQCIRSWRAWLRPVCAIVYVIAVIVLVSVLVDNYVKNGIPNRDYASLLGGAFVLLAIPISVWEIVQHMVYFSKPSHQKHIIRILWMVPMYAVNAWLGLLYPEQSIYMDSARECYEAYVIYNFMKFLLNYLNENSDLEASLENKPQVNHFFPLCCLTPWEMGREFVHMCKHGILQYTVVRPLTTLISVLCELAGVYGEGEFKPNVAFPYIMAVNNVTQFTAMYCLVLFYRANAQELKPMKPLGKFLCIKAVVFFSFFQGVIINILVYYNVISSIFNTDNKDTIRTLSSKLQDFLICIEMFLAAIAHHYSFSHKSYIVSTEDPPTCCGAFIAMFDLSDVKNDISEHFGVVGSSLSRRIRGRSSYSLARGEDEHSRLVNDAGPSTSSVNTSINSPMSTDEVFSPVDGADVYIRTAYGSIGSTEPLLNTSEQKPDTDHIYKSC